MRRIGSGRLWGPVLVLTVGLVGAALPASAAANCLGQDLTKPVGTLNGTPGRDVLLGTSAGETMNGLGGNDIICGGGGRHHLRRPGVRQPGRRRRRRQPLRPGGLRLPSRGRERCAVPRAVRRGLRRDAGWAGRTRPLRRRGRRAQRCVRRARQGHSRLPQVPGRGPGRSGGQSPHLRLHRRADHRFGDLRRGGGVRLPVRRHPAGRRRQRRPARLRRRRLPVRGDGDDHLIGGDGEDTVDGFNDTDTCEGEHLQLCNP